MLKRIILVLLVPAFLLTACGPQATPTMNPADVQGTAVAAAWTMVAMTQQAIPTATQLPPSSPTPLPTFTLEPLPTSNIIVPTFGAPTYSAPTQVVDSNNCLIPLDIVAAGPLKNVRIENATGGTLNLSLNLNPKNAFGQCGSLSYPGVAKNAKFIINIPAGNWFAYAWVDLKGGTQSTSQGSFSIGPSKSKDLLRLVIKKDVIGLLGP